MATFKRGYVLDGYPTTVDQAKMLFRLDDTNLLQSNIDINKLPGTNIYIFFLKIQIQDTLYSVYVEKCSPQQTCVQGCGNTTWQVHR